MAVCLFLLFLSDKSSPNVLMNVRAAGKGDSLSNRSGKVADNPSAAYDFYRATVATKLTLEPSVVIV
jgi:hypothetical protein